MAKTTFLGHPLHPQLILAPAALLPFSFALDVMHSATGDDSYADAAYYSMVGGYAGGLAAAAAGAADYLELPEGSRSKRLGTVHGAMNLGMIGLYTANLLMRRSRRPPSKLAKLLSGVGTAGLLVSAWYGAHLVYEYGVRVKGVSPIEDAPELAPPGDEEVKRALEAAGERVTPAPGAVRRGE